MTIKALYPTVRPTLNLDFAKTKVLDPRVTFTRASTATFVDANGLIQSAASGASRFDHDPTTGESLGLLVEAARTNLITYSEQFDNAAWGKQAGTTVSPNSITSPDGTQSADSISFATSAQLYRSFSIANGTVYTASIYVKPLAGSTSLTFYLYQAGNAKACVFTFSADGSTVSVGTPSGSSNATFSAITVGGGWFKLVGIFTSTGTSMEFDFFTSIASQSFGLWGAQLESGSFPTSYIPTTTATVTRAADVAIMTGTNFSSWYNQSQGTIFASVRTVTPASVANGLLQLTDGTVNNRIEFGQVNSGAAFPRVQGLYRYLSSTTASFLNDETGWIPNGATVDNWAFGFNSTGCTFQTKFDTTPSTGSGTFPQNLTNFSIGHKGTIARLAYYPVRLPDAQLQALTAT